MDKSLVLNAAAFVNRWDSADGGRMLLHLVNNALECNMHKYTRVVVDFKGQIKSDEFLRTYLTTAITQHGHLYTKVVEHINVQRNFKTLVFLSLFDAACAAVKVVQE